MRVGPVGWVAKTEEEAMTLAKLSAECTHNHKEGIKGAQAVALAIYMARKGKNKDEIKRAIASNFNYDLSMSVSELNKRYSWYGVDNKGNGGTWQDSVPQAIICGLEAEDFEDAIRNAISIGGDSDTIGCICESIAEPSYGIPYDLYTTAFSYLLSYLPQRHQKIIEEFESKYGSGRKQ